MKKEQKGKGKGKGKTKKGEAQFVEFEGGSKRDWLIDIDKEIEELWSTKAEWFETDAQPVEDEEKNGKQPKFMCTFPYPYMNGRLHLGHAFTLTKAEFVCRYHRMTGKRVLYPFSFHCTGMPIKACADKLAREIEAYGNPPDIEKARKAAEEEAAIPKEEAEVVDFINIHSKKSKAAAKKSVGKLQWEIMESMGVPKEDIAKFADAYHWLEYFPPRAMEDLRKLGLHVDWRRSFITTDVNPYYDSFARWQLATLNELGKVKFGERYSVYSPSDGQPCQDHDRQSGEGVLPQEYVLVKQKLMEPFPEPLKQLEGRNVYLVPATLRPETMYGQTNCFILPHGLYGAFEISDDEVFICCPRAANNLSYQGHSKNFGEPVCLATFKGEVLLGACIRAPMTPLPFIRVLPMTTISLEKGTGIVTSVPSDSPDDYITLQDLKTNENLRTKYGIEDEWIMPLEVIEIVDVPDYGTKCAVKACQDAGIKNQHQKKKLEEAKKAVYLKGFHEGVMIVGKYKGRKVSEVKSIIRDELIADGVAILYSEPASTVISRSGDECVCALTDQYYITYGEKEWRTATEALVAEMETYGEEVRHMFKGTLDWLDTWPCSRTYGLGSKIPWDEQYLIESLSDSTVYMAYYTVAHLLQGKDNIDGSKTGPAGITPEQLTTEVWDYIFLGKDFPKDTDIPKETLDQLRREFEYWYPMDLRVSGKDLIPNHLTFCLYTHVAMFPPELWPRSMRANGHLMLNNAKMSKSTGNFMTLYDAMEQYSTDIMRFTLADAGDSIEDANFTNATANKLVLRLDTLYKWFLEIFSKPEELTDDRSGLMDDIFENEMNRLIAETTRSMEEMKYHEALRTGFFEFMAIRDNYRSAVANMNNQLIKSWSLSLIAMLSPFCPHFCEYVYQNVWLKLINPDDEIRSIIFAKWPVAGEVDVLLSAKNQYIFTNLHEWHVARNRLESKNKGKSPTTCNLYISNAWPDWQINGIKALKDAYDPSTGTFASDYKAKIGRSGVPKRKKGKLFALAETIKSRVEVEGPQAMELTIPFDEQELMTSIQDFLKSTLKVEVLNIYNASEKGIPGNENTIENSVPLTPSFIFSYD